jgi:pimeloyl-ACP methyl ester carboxylesterase
MDTRRSIEAVLIAAKVKRAVLVGHSNGHAGSSGSFIDSSPEQTAGLVIVDGALRMMFPKEQVDQFIAPMKADYKTAAPGVVDGMVAPIKDEKLKQEIKTAMLSTPDYVALSAMENMFDPSVYKTDTIKVPVLAVLAKSPILAAGHRDFSSFTRA